MFSNYVWTLQELVKAEQTMVASSIRLAHKHWKHVGQCMLKFAVESISIDQLTSANEEEHMMLWVIWDLQVDLQNVIYM